jgi:hypothetical protein
LNQYIRPIQTIQWNDKNKSNSQKLHRDKARDGRTLPYVIFEERLNGKFSEIAVEFNLSDTGANLSNPTNFSGNSPDSPDSTRFRKF